MRLILEAPALENAYSAANLMTLTTFRSVGISLNQAVYIEFVTNPTSDKVLEFLVHAWMKLRIPAIVQFDDGKEFCSWGTAARSLSRVIRLALRLQVEVCFIPEGKPCYSGSVEQFNGSFQPLLLECTYHRLSDVRRQVSRLISTVNEQHVYAHLGHRTTVTYRRGEQLQKLFLHQEKLTISVSKVSFIRLVSPLEPYILESCSLLNLRQSKAKNRSPLNEFY